MTLVELFAGAGGASLGLVAAGFTEVRAVEWNHDACETRRAAGLRCDEGDVRDPAHYEGVEADAVWSSFPCQAWSTAGKRLGKDDPRNGWPWSVDVIDQVKPTWFMAENVPGLTHHRGGCNGRCVDDCARLYFEQTILADLRARFASVQWSILDAARFGVPQNLERLIIVAGPRPIVWPRETHAPPEELIGLFETRRPWVTVRQALGLGGSMESGSKCRRDADGIPRGPLVVGTDRPSLTIDSRAVDVRIVRESGVGAEREPRSVDEPSYTLRVQHNGGGCGVSVVGIATAHKPGVPIEERERVDLTDRPAWTVAADVGRNRGGAMQVIEDPKHPHVRPDAPAPALRSGGAGHSAPPMWLRTGNQTLLGNRDRTEPYERSVDEPSPTVRVTMPHELVSRSVDSTEEGGPFVWAAGWTGDGLPTTSDIPAPTVSAKGTMAVTPTRAASRPELLDKPSPAILAREVKGNTGDALARGRASAIQCASDVAFLGAGIRRLSPAECATLQAFPPDHPWRGTKTSIYAQIGNAVPPTLARVVAESVRAASTAHLPESA